MNNSTINIADLYMNELFVLSDTEKVDLATKLLNSIKRKVSSLKNSRDPFAGLSDAWDDGKTTEEMEKDLRSHRTFNRQVENW